MPGIARRKDSCGGRQQDSPEISPAACVLRRGDRRCFPSQLSWSRGSITADSHGNLTRPWKALGLEQRIVYPTELREIRSGLHLISVQLWSEETRAGRVRMGLILRDTTVLSEAAWPDTGPRDPYTTQPHGRVFSV